MTVGADQAYLLGRALRDPVAAAEIIESSNDNMEAAADVAAMTDNSTGAAGATIAAGVGIYDLSFPLSSLATGIGAGALDLLTTYVINHKFKLLSFDFITTIVGAGAGASQVFNLEIGATDLTGGVLTVTLASTDTIGKVTQGTAITALNTGAAAGNISLEKAGGGTVFTSGAGYFRVTVQNMDTADAIASIITKCNLFRTNMRATNLML